MHKQLIIPEGDVLIFAGDMCGIGTEKEIIDFNNWLGEQSCKYKIVVAGNHDGPLAEFPSNYKSNLLSNAYYLENSEVIIDGIKFYGSPITPTFCDWYFMANRGKEIQKYWNMIPNDTNVLIGHGMPYGILDFLVKANGDLGECVGDLDLLNKIKKLEKLKLYVGGHLHSGYGIFKQEGLTFINASNCNEEYEIVNKPIIYDYN